LARLRPPRGVHVTSTRAPGRSEGGEELPRLLAQRPLVDLVRTAARGGKLQAHPILEDRLFLARQDGAEDIGVSTHRVSAPSGPRGGPATVRTALTSASVPAGLARWAAKPAACTRPLSSSPAWAVSAMAGARVPASRSRARS